MACWRDKQLEKPMAETVTLELFSDYV